MCFVLSSFVHWFSFSHPFYIHCFYTIKHFLVFIQFSQDMCLAGDGFYCSVSILVSITFILWYVGFPLFRRLIIAFYFIFCSQVFTLGFFGL